MESNEEIKYVPSATIVYDASFNALHNEPELATAQDVSIMHRRIKSLRSEVNDYESNTKSVRDYLIENYEEMGEHAQEIADLMGIELTRETSITVTVEFRVELSLKPEETIDGIVDTLEFHMNTGEEVTEYYADDVTWEER